MAYVKTDLILKGLKIKHKFNDSDLINEVCALRHLSHHLGMLIEDLTSAVKTDREFAKKEVRELVKLGKDTTP